MDERLDRRGATGADGGMRNFLAQAFAVIYGGGATITLVWLLFHADVNWLSLWDPDGYFNIMGAIGTSWVWPLYWLGVVGG